MAGFNKIELRHIVERDEDGSIKRTEHVRYEWFEMGRLPPLYQPAPDGCFWANTAEFHFGKEKPQS